VTGVAASPTSILRWVAGFLLFNVAQAGDALALRFAPQSVVQPAGSVRFLATGSGWVRPETETETKTETETEP
jgi:hypothetical protein